MKKYTQPSLKTFLPYDRVRGLISNVWFVVFTGSVGLLEYNTSKHHDSTLQVNQMSNLSPWCDSEQCPQTQTV